MSQLKWHKAPISGYNHQKRQNQINKNIMKVNKRFSAI